MAREPHIEQPYQGDIHECPHQYDDPHHRRHRGGNGKQSQLTLFDIVVEFFKRLCMHDLLAYRRGLELEKPFMKRGHCIVSLFGNDPFALIRPGDLDQIARVVPQEPNQVLALRVRIGRDIGHESRQG